MKFILIVSIYALSICSTFSGEVTGAGGPMKTLLKNTGYTNTFLKKNGLTVTLGEVTGAGKVHVDDVHAYLTNDNLLKDSDIIAIDFAIDTPAKRLKDIKSIQFNQIRIIKNQIKAIIHKESP